MRIFALLLISYIIVISLEAAIGGEVGVAYKNDERTSNETESRETEFIQFLGLNYADYVYSPNLLLYDIRSRLEYNQVGTDGESSSSDKDSQNHQYNINLRFFQKSYFPFTVYARKTQDETSSTTINSTRSVQDSSSYGINGNVKWDEWWTDYSISFDELDKESSFTSEQRKDQKIDLTLGKMFGLNKGQVNVTHQNNALQMDDSIANSKTNSTYERNAINFYLDGQHANAELGYSVNEQENKEGDINYINGDKGSTDKKYRALYRYKPSQEFTFESSANYSTNDEDEIENQDIIANILWKPFDRLDITTNMFMNSIDSNTSETKTYNIDTYANYRYNQALTLSGRLSSYLIESSSDKNSAYLADGGLSFNYPFGTRYAYSLYANLGASSESHTDTDLEERTTITNNINNRLSIKFETHKAQLDFGLDFYQLYSSLSEESRRIRFSTDFFGYPMDRLRYLLSFNYINNTDQRYDSTLKALTDPNITERWELSGKLDYSQAVGIKGKFFSGVGIKRTTYMVPESEDALSIFADATFSYRFMHTLFYTLRGNIRDDSLNGTMEYSLFNEINYTFRRIKISLNNEFWEASRDEGNSEHQIRTMLQLSRIF